MSEAKDVLAGLLDTVEEQLSAEYPDEARRAEELENMTVKRLLEILSYVFQ